MHWTIGLAVLLAGCGAMQAMGLADAMGEPTETAHAANAIVQGVTGVDILKVWGAVKGAEALFTKRGLENTANVFSPAASWKSTMWSLAALVVGAHTPAEAKKG
jgi:hypothetical protein